MRLSTEEKQSLLGPMVVGCLLGAFVAYAAFAFDSELRLNGLPVSTGHMIMDALQGFALSLVSTLGLLGVVPIVVGRVCKSRQGDI